MEHLLPDSAYWGHGYLTDDQGHRVHYTRGGRGQPVVCLHGWPGFWYDYRRLRPLLEPHADVLTVDLRGYGASDKPDVPVAEYGRQHQAQVVRSVMDGLDLASAIVVGYDIGSGIAIQLARDAPERVTALVLGNPMHPGAGRLALHPDHRGEFWYQDFHQLPLASELIDGDRDRVAAYLSHFYAHWSHRQEAVAAAHLEAVIDVYRAPGAFTASLNWYRSGSGTIGSALAARDQPLPPPVTTPATVLWGAADPLFPARFADGLDHTLVNHQLTVLDDVGHFVPLEAAAEMTEAVRHHLA